MTVRTTDHPLAADVICDDGTIRIEVEVPGVTRSQLDVRASGYTVTVHGRRTSAHAGRYLLMERGRDLERSFDLPHETDMRNLHAHVCDGMLIIDAPFGAGRPADQAVVELRPSIYACHPDAASI